MTTTFLTNKSSLTEHFVISNIQTLKQRQTTDNDLGYFLKSEVITRIVAVSTSIFALVDTIYYTFKTITSCTTLILYNLNVISLAAPPTSDEIEEEAGLAATFALTTLIGSIVLTIYPSACCPSNSATDDSTATDDSAAVADDEFDYIAFGMTKEEYQYAVQIQKTFDQALHTFVSTNTPVDFDVDATATAFNLPKTWEESAAQVQELWSKATDKTAFETKWKASTLTEKREFVHILDADKSAEGVAAKAKLVDTIYRHGKDTSYGYYKTPITSWPEQNAAAFYHATKIGGLEGILKNGKVEVRHQGMFKGAFVSTQPELSYGNYVLVFRRNIEHMSELQHKSFSWAYWAGFKKDIPVNEYTLEKILVRESSFSSYDPSPGFFSSFFGSSTSNVSSLDKLKASVKKWAGRDIKVEKYNYQDFSNINHIIPKSWDKPLSTY